MKRALLLLLGLSLSSLLTGTGCGGDDTAPASQDKTGAPACDAYVARLEACAGRAPAEQRPAHDAAIRVARDRFEEKADKAASDADRVALEDACKRMTESLAVHPGCS